MKAETFEQLAHVLSSTSAELAQEIGALALFPSSAELGGQLQRIERARQKRDVAARAMRLARLTYLRGHPQAGGHAT